MKIDQYEKHLSVIQYEDNCFKGSSRPLQNSKASENIKRMKRRRLNPQQKIQWVIKIENKHKDQTTTDEELDRL